MARALLIILDSFGIGGAPDAAQFGDEGANTLLHIAERCAAGDADLAGVRTGPLRLPNLDRLGLGSAAQAACGLIPPGLNPANTVTAWTAATEVSNGKDTPSGHWELTGVPVRFDWGYFPRKIPALPETLTQALLSAAQLPGILGNKHASGTEIIAELGSKHIASGKPICYTSSDSVLQIAAHEQTFGLDRLYRVCEVARQLVDPLNIGRVIARPFVGQDATDFERTGNRRDYSVPPPAPTVLDNVIAKGGQVHAIGKIADIFANQGISKSYKANGNENVHKATLQAISQAKEGDLIVANYVDFDTLYGHRRDVIGYANALEHFDAWVPDLLARLKPSDLLIITADHGCDPTWPGTDHTRERVPVLTNADAAAHTLPSLSDSLAVVATQIHQHFGFDHADEEMRAGDIGHNRAQHR